MEQDPAKVENYLQQLRNLGDYRTVYVDETSSSTYLYREYGRAKKGEIVKGCIKGKKYQRTSLIAAKIGQKLIAPMVYKETMVSHFFEEWFETFLLPELTEKSVIIMNNAAFHRIDLLQEMAKKHGHVVLPLPPYSPDLNPIEKVWANLKKYMRKVISKYGTFEEALLSYSYLK